jgi:hypothetical protein
MSVVGEPMTFEIFPPATFPPELAAAAFVSGNEAAWRPVIAANAVEWLAAHGYGVLGTELWLLKKEGIQSLPIGRSGGREVHGNTVNRRRDESWNLFVARAAAETTVYLRAFDPADIVEDGDLHFQVVWVSESEFAELEKNSRERGCNLRAR